MGRRRRGWLRSSGSGGTRAAVLGFAALAVAATAASAAGAPAAPFATPAAAADNGPERDAPAEAAAATHVPVPARTIAGSEKGAIVPGAAAANSTHMFVVDAGGNGSGGRILVYEYGRADGAAGRQGPSAVIEVGGTPYGVAVNGTGHLFASDPRSGRVHVFGPGGERIDGLPAPAGAAAMDWPAGVAAGPDGRVYVAERNAGRILVFDGTGGAPAAISQAGPAGRLLAPTDVAVGPSGGLYVADAAADAVHVFGAGGAYVRTVEVTSLNGAPGSPHGAAVDPRSGGLYVASLLQGAVHSYNTSGAPSGAPAALAPQPGAPPAAVQPRPLSVAVRGDGLLLVTDAGGGGAVLAHPNGTVHSVVAGRWAGGGGNGSGSGADEASAGGRTGPLAAADAAEGGRDGAGGGAVYVADAGAGAVSAYSRSPPSGAGPAPLWTSDGYGGNGGGAGPAGIAVDGSGRVLVSYRGDTGSLEVRALAAGDGSPAGTIYSGSGLGRAAGVAAGPGGAVAVADPAAGAVVVIGTDGTRAATISSLDDPVDAAFMSDGSIVVAERGAHMVRVFDAGAIGGGSPDREAAVMVAEFGLGAGGVFMPEAVAVDGNDRIVVADAGGSTGGGPRVQVFDYAGRLVSQFDGGGGRYGAPAGLGTAPDEAVLLSGTAGVRAFGALDADAPAVASFGIAVQGGGPGAAGAALGPYSVVVANVTFTEPVVVRPPREGGGGEGEAAADLPVLSLGISNNGSAAGSGPDASVLSEFCGTGGGAARYGSGSGTASLLFPYTVAPGDYAPALGYAPARPLDPRGSSITDAAGNRAVLSMPGAPGEAIAVDGGAGAFVDVVLLAANASAADSRAAALAACDLNRELAASTGGPFLNLTAAEVPRAADAGAFGGWVDARAALVAEALQASHAEGRGPSAYIATLPGEVLATPVGPLPNSTVAGYAGGHGLLFVATAAASSVPSLYADSGGGATLYRIAPGGEHMAFALGRAIGPEIDVLFPIIQEDLFGEPAPARPGAAPFSHGLYGLVLGHLRDAGGIVGGLDAGLLNYDRTRRAEFNFTAPHGRWGADAPVLDLNLALLKGQVGDGRVAVLYLGSAAEYVRLAEAAAGLPSLPGTRWLAAGDVAASPLVEGSEAAASLAASTGLEAVAFGVGGGGDGTEAAARIDETVGPAPGEAARAYSAYDAVQIVGRAASIAAAAAGGAAQPQGGGLAAPSAAEISRAMEEAALGYSGALGNVRIDGASGDLDLPLTYDVWRVGEVSGTWERASVKRGIDSCSVSLSAPDLDFGPVKARAASAPLRQAISNTGSLALTGVALGPGEWSLRGAAGDGEAGAAAAAKLPAALTEYIDESAPRAARFAAVSPDLPGAAVVARGLEPAEETGLLLRLNLRAVQSLDGIVGMEQSMTYTASCE